jgi:hypothetical protein
LDDTGPNPHTENNAWVKWKKEFIEACEDAGADFAATCPRQGLNTGTATISVCYCCKKVCKKE